MNYQQAVQKNLDHLGTPASDWLAVPVLGMEEVDAGEGKFREMPVFSFPQGYSKAPALYTGECCNLCGTTIKNVYWIQNDKRRWIMPVGSECVTHFGDGESGQAVAKKTVWEQNSSVLADLIKMRRCLWQAYSKRVGLGYGRYETKIWPHSLKERNAERLHQAIKKCVGKVTEESGNAAITRWAKKNRELAEQLINEAQEILADDLNVLAEIHCNQVESRAV